MLAGIAAHPASWGVFSWSSATPQPWPTVLDEIADSGYRGVELGRVGFFPTEPTRLRSELDARGLELVAGFIVAPLDGADQLASTRTRANELCALLAEAGARHLVVIDLIGGSNRAGTAGRSGAAPRLELTAWRSLIETLHTISTVAQRHGLNTAFHPHAGTNVEFEDEIERLLSDTDPSLVGLCLDTGHSLFAGIDPVDFYRRHRSRVHYLHLKDIEGDKLVRSLERRLTFQQAVGEGVFCPLGEGILDLDELRETLAATGYDGWLTVEQDRVGETTCTARADAEASLARLRAAGFAHEEGGIR